MYLARVRLDMRVAESAADRARCVAVRVEVFVDEQKVPAEIEVDEHDATDAIHFLAVDGESGDAIGAARFVPFEGAAKIGRVAVKRSARGTGAGAELMRFVMKEARARGYASAVLDAQTYAIGFYEKLGFVAEGPVFDDAGMPHRRMRRAL